jgi:hypothetical protein
MVIEAKIKFCGQNIENTYYRHDTEYHNFNAIAYVFMILVHPQDNAIQNLHWKFEVNSLKTAICGFRSAIWEKLL